MSLVNDMLKDLDSSEAGQKRASTAIELDRDTQQSGGGSDYGRDTATKSQSWSKLSAFIVFFGILGIYYVWQLQPEGLNESLASQVEPAPVDDTLLNAEVLAVLDEAEEQAGLTPKSGPAVGFQNEVVSEHVRKQNQVIELVNVPDKPAAIANVENHIRTLLDAGHAALKLDRLQTPKQDNAYDRFTAVLALQPANVEAQQGLEKIQQRYLGFIKSVIKKGHYYKVPELVKKAREVGAQQQDIDSMLDSMPVSASKPAKDVIKHLEIDKSKSVNEPVSGAAAQAVTESFTSIDLRTAQQALELQNDGLILQADALLKTFITENPNSIYAFQKLFDSYLSQQRLKDAGAMIDRAAHLPGEIFSYMVGQLLTRRGDHEGAMRALNMHQPNMEKRPGYYALKAGLLHKMERHSDAIVVYQQLIIFDKGNPNYWLGLAVSMDSLQADQALSVFQKVRQLSAPQATYLAYVDKRIAELTKPESSEGHR